VEALRSFARREAPELGSVDLRGAVESAAAALRGRMAPGDELRIEGETPPVRASAPELERLFTNLIANALDATAGRGEVRVGIRAEAGQAEVTVDDSGSGIPTESLPRLFDPFFTTKEVGQGTGLGLSVCYGIVRRFGGTIEAINRPEGGARFRVRLPLYAQESLG
jgi:signal transduction histidine kinase